MVTSMRRQRHSRETLQVVGVTAMLLLFSAAVGHPFLGTSAVSASLSLPWWFFALTCALTEFVVMHVQLRREAQTVSVSELPLVLGLFFAAPAALLVGRVLGSVLVLAFHRKSPPLKIAFNTALMCTEVAVAVAVFRVMDPGSVAVGPYEWLAAYVAVLLANAVAIVALNVVLHIYEGGMRLRSLLMEAATGQCAAPLVITLALVAVDSVATDPESSWLLVASAVVLLLAYRSYSKLFDRHHNLERMYHFSQAVTSSPETDEVLRSVLEEAGRLLSSEYSQLTFPGQTDADVPARVRLGPSGEIIREDDPAGATDHWLLTRVIGHGDTVLLPRNSPDGNVRTWLQDHGLRDAIAVPLQGSSGTVGMLLVGERWGEVRTYDERDVPLLLTLANHASIALQKGELIERLQHDALHDALTSLPNRTHLQRRLTELITGQGSVPSPPLAVMVLDLDGFKDINDTLGHHQGDLVLIEVARRLTAVVGSRGLVARLGGDEFAVLARGVGVREEALELSQGIITALQEPITLADMSMEVGASVGISLSPLDGADQAVLLKRADMAMYDAKASGRGVRFYEPRIDTASARRLSMVGELRTALQAGDVEVHVQPQADAVSGKVRSVEALARWDHDQLGTVSPTEFIPVAERSGLIRPLTVAILDASLAGATAWRDLDVSVAVNLSPRSLLDSNLVKEVANLLARHRTPADRLVLEVTEGAVMADPTRAIALLQQLNDMGVRLSVDDFGTGYSSLSYLKRLPVHEVKIDRSFVTGLTRGSEDIAIVRSIVDLGRHLGLEIVAEGVEDQPTLDLLREIGCTRVQGWHISRPMPIAVAGTWLRHWNSPTRPTPLARTA